MKLKRSSGILLHISSLPSPFGIGDLGPAAYKFVDFLKASGHRYWQILPLNPTNADLGFSPYSSHAAFAGNPLLISPELLENEGLIDLKNFPYQKGLNLGTAAFKEAETFKNALLEGAFQNFISKKKDTSGFSRFCKQHASWLDDFSLFMALRKKYENRGWVSWPEELRDRKPDVLKKAQQELSKTVEKQKYFQFLFFSQWKQLTEYAHKKQVSFIGDLPFYITHDSVDCWAHPEYFKLNAKKQPTKVSGVPPDFFSETGQLWGTPVFNWKNLRQNNFDWWVKRIKQNLLLFDMLRLDHFRAFSAYWEIKAGEKTAVNGKWVKTPGSTFFKTLKKEIPEMPFIAEDLGTLDEPVYKLLDKVKFPGMKVLQFAFGEPLPGNPYIPFNHSPHNIVYTGTHDNNTSIGWFKNAGKTEKDNLFFYAGIKVTSQNIHRVLHDLALKSVAAIAIIPLQDIIGLGEEAVMNTPGTTEGNWTWRVSPEDIPWEKVQELKKKNIFYGRSSE